MTSLFQIDLLYPYAIPPLLTFLLCFILTAITIQAGRTRSENKFFSLYCLLQAFLNLDITLMTICNSKEVALSIGRLDHMFYVFIIPVGVHFIHEVAGIHNRKKLVWSLYLFSLIMVFFTQTDYYFYDAKKYFFGFFNQGGPAFQIFGCMSILATLYTARILWVMFKNAVDPGQRLKAQFILYGVVTNAALTLGNIFPILGIEVYPPGNFGFVPLGLMAYGLLQHDLLEVTKENLSKDFIPRLLILFVWLPLISSIILWLIAGENFFHPNLYERIIPYAIPPIFSFLVCFIIATVCFMQTIQRTTIVLFALICTLWGFLNLDITMNMLLADKYLALQVSRISHLFLVNQLGIIVHFIYSITNRKQRWTFVYPCYLIGFILMPFTQTDFYFNGSYEYYWGFYAKGNIAFHFFSIAASIATIWGIILLYKANRSETNANIKKRYLYVLVGVVITAILNFCDIPALNGFEIYPLGNFTFIPILIIAYGIFRHDILQINQYTKRRILDIIVKVMVAGGYTALIPICYWAIGDFSWNYISSRIVPYGIPPLLTFLCGFFLSILSLRVGLAQKESLIFALMCLLWSFLNIDILLNGIIVDPIIGLQLNRWDHFFFVFIPALALHLTYLVIHRQKKWWVVYSFYFVSLLLSPMTQSKYYFYDMYKYYWGFFAKGGIAFDIFGAYCILATIYSIYLLIQTYIRESEPFQRHRILYLASGFVGYAVLTLGDIPAVKGIELYPPGNFSFILLLLFAYGLFKQNLKETMRITRSIIFWIGLIFILLAMAATLKPIFPTDRPVSLYLAGIVSVLLFYKLVLFVWNNILSLFFGHEKGRLDEILISLIDDLSKGHNRSGIQSIVKNCILDELSSSNMVMLFSVYPDSLDGKKTLKSSRGLEGCEYLNPKKSLFSSKDQFGVMDKNIKVAPNHPLISIFDDYRSSASRDQIEEWMIDHDISLDTGDRLRQSELILPVYFEENLTCLILLGNKIDGTVYSTDEKEFVHRLGLSLGPCIENANLLEKFERKVEERTSELQTALEETRIKEHEIVHINQVIQTVNSTLDLDKVTASVGEALREVFQFDQMSIQLIDEETKELVFIKISGDEASQAQLEKVKNNRISLTEHHSVFISPIIRKKPLYLPEIPPEMEPLMVPCDREIYRIFPAKAYLFVPLEIQNQIIGVMGFGNTKTFFDLSKKDIEKIQHFVPQVATAINNARLFEELDKAKKMTENAIHETKLALEEAKSKEQEIAHINKVLQVINSTLDLNTVIESITSALQDIFPFNQVGILMFDEKQNCLRSPRFFGDGLDYEKITKLEKTEIPLKKNYSIFVDNILAGQPVYLPQVNPDMRPLMYPFDQEVHDIILGKAYLFCPMEIQKKIVGTINFGNSRDYFKLSRKDIEKIQRYVSQIATAIHNAHLADEIKQANENLKLEIRERQKATEALSQSEEKYRNILDNMDDFYAELDLAGNFVFFNQAHSVALDLAPEELMNKSYNEFIDESTAKRVFNEFHELFLTGNAKLIGWEAISKKGRKVYAEAIVSLQKNSEGQPIGFRYLARDVTLKRKAEMELKKAKEAAEATTKAKSEFLANMSHEIRTPMNAILGMADLLSETALFPEQKTFAQTINSSGELLLSIINDILDFSKIEAGQMALEETSFDLRELVETAGKMLAVKAHEKSIELNCRVALDVNPFRIGDPTRLRQIFINLLNNAIKFTHHGEVILEVVNSDDPELLLFCVRDTGIGIPKEKQQIIFDSFSQVDTSITRKYGGTGLGLAICKRLVDLMGGHIWIESEEGVGTRFFFTVRSHQTAPISTSVTVSPTELEGMQALVVDDNETNRLICKELLSSWGASVDESESGAQAIQLVSSAERAGKPYHLILLDLRMPEIDGFQVAEQINAMPLTHEPQMIMLTSSDTIDEKTRACALNIAAYIVKPFRRVELLEGILIAMGKKEKTAEQRPKPVGKLEGMPLPALRILLAEDIEANRNLLKQYLKDTPIVIDIAENGRIALEKYTRNRYDIVLMDIEMPEMDGLSATQAIRKWEQETGKPKTPVIALTAHAFSEHREKCFAAGCSGYLTKPVKKKVLIEKLLQFAGSGAIEQTCPDKTADKTIDKIDDLKFQHTDYIVKIDQELESLIPDFMSQTQDDVTSMRAALEKQDSETLRRIGHSLKGSAFMYEFKYLGNLGMAIEEAAKRNDLAFIEKQVEKLDHYMACVQIVYYYP